jgi:pyruvate formate lyase activating enzyme
VERGQAGIVRLRSHYTIEARADRRGISTVQISDFPGLMPRSSSRRGVFSAALLHNGSLIPLQPAPGEGLPESTILDFFKTPGQLDGLVVTVGEPTLQDGLLEFLTGQGDGIPINWIPKEPPGGLAELLAEHLLDFIAMDVKAPWDLYDRLTASTLTGRRSKSASVWWRPVASSTNTELPMSNRCFPRRTWNRSGA